YYKGKSCRQQLAYANDTLKKRIIPIYANTVKDYRATGRLSIRIAPLKYIHFAIVEQITTTDENQSPSVLCNKPLKEWTAEDVNSWFNQNNIHPDLKNLYQFRTDTALILYFDHLKSNQSREYQITYDLYEDKYEKTLNTAYFINFVDVLTRLKEKQQYETNTKTIILKSCIIN
ncbi:unnamed protein product, partial [Didymodactylos carnosus]